MRLIDADALVEKAYWHGEHPDVGNPFAEGVDAVDMSDIDNAPTIEAKPVRNGRWEWFEEWSPSTPESPKECTDCGWRCGECKVKLDDMVGWYWADPYDEPKLNYCPNCGMKVDE